MAASAGIRRTGAAALDLAWVAAGRFDGYWERGLGPWDLAAGIVILREAGGFISDADGKDRMLEQGSVVAGNETIHRKLLKLLKMAAADHAAVAAVRFAVLSRSPTSDDGLRRRSSHKSNRPRLYASAAP